MRFAVDEYDHGYMVPICFLYESHCGVNERNLTQLINSL